MQFFSITSQLCSDNMVVCVDMTSKSEEQQGSLFDQIVRHSGLDKEVVVEELGEYLHQRGKKIEELTLNDIRSIVSQYVRKTFLEMSDS